MAVIQLFVAVAAFATVSFWHRTRRLPRPCSTGPNQDAAPNGGPATPVGNSGVTEGPPSVS
jgi:hypothetical protein